MAYPQHRWLALIGLIVAVAIGTWPAAVAAQGDEPAPPEGWLVRTDTGGHGGGELEFMDMPPGWHITTGPAGIFYDPGTMANGDFRVESTVFLFDPGPRNEAFGIFVGGDGLEGDAQAYTYFLIRRDGNVLVKRRDGAQTSTLHGWARHDAVVTWDARGEGEATAENVLFVEATGTDLIFGVNGEEVFRTAREGQHVDGIVGLRVNHGLNLHFSSLEVTGG